VLNKGDNSALHGIRLYIDTDYSGLDYTYFEILDGIS